MHNTLISLLCKKSDYEVMALPRFSSSPVRGYHIEPYACAVAVELAQMKYPHMKKSMILVKTGIEEDFI